MPNNQPYNPNGVVTFAQKAQSFLSTGQNYLIGLDFSAEGVFADTHYSQQMTCDESKVIITPNQNQKTVGKCYWTIYIPADAPAGTYLGIKDLLLTVTLKGTGWNGGAGVFNGVWDAPIAVQ